MNAIRRSNERGRASHGWLESFHSFSFSEYYDEKHMGHSVLRVINEDFIAANQGFATHAHRDMEIVTYVISGCIEHKDSLGSVGQIRRGEVQRMSAGTGIRHSEHNPQKDELTHLLQIWIVPDRQGHTPSYEQVDLLERFKTQEFVLLASSNGQDGSTTIHQDTKIFAGNFQSSKDVKLPLCASRNGWLQLIEGHLKFKDQTLSAGDAIQLSKEEEPMIKVQSSAHFLFFDLP
jgi:redox-sensitive bicupin YhaK (pirin superfamily)